MDKIFVTGANGFLGENIINYFSKNYEIVAYSRHPVSLIKCTWVQGDILDKEKLINSMKGCKIVIHLAAITSYNEINESPLVVFDNYINGTINILEAMRSTKANTLIYPSSGKVYGFLNKLPYKETDYAHPSNLMGKMKLEVENIISLYSKIIDDNIKFVVFRIFNAYGKGQSEKFLIPKIINHINKSEIELGRIDIKRDYIHIEDILSAIKIVIDKAPGGYNVYNLGYGVPVSVEEIIEKICNIRCCNINVIRDISQIRNDERDIEYSDISKLSSLGWRPKIGLDSGLRKLLLETNE